LKPYLDPVTRYLIAALLVVSAGLFVIGVTSESDGDTHSDEPSAESTEHSEANETSEVRANEGEERVLGLDLESPAPIAGALLLSAALAGLVLWRPDRRVLVVIAIASGAFAVLDIAEVIHQLDEDRTGLATLAATIAAMHAAVAALAVWHTAPASSGQPSG
jgi:hypothetical protein